MTTPPVSTRRSETRARLVEGAKQMFALKGISGSSVEEICDRAGFTRGAFYSNYSNKNELARDILEGDVDDVYRIIGDMLQDQEFHSMAMSVRSGGTSPMSAVVGLMCTLTKTQYGQAEEDDNQALVIHEMRLGAARDPQIREHYMAYQEQTRQRLWPYVRDAAALAGLRWKMDGPTVMAIIDSQFDAMLVDMLLHPDAVRGPDLMATQPIIALILAMLEPDPHPQEPDEVLSRFPTEQAYDGGTPQILFPTTTVPAW